ncbi:MAG: cytochrome c biogenesis protein CcdA, partial [Bacteroidaceae bacterium]|nr:cytochrome c biogenesis protein CcdA [Bacteroidaceae bacterium]
GEASFVQTLAITEPAYEVSGYLTYGACSDQNCMPPTDVEFSFKGNSEAVADPAAKPAENEMRPEENKIPSGGKISEGHENWWKPVVEELQSFGQDEQAADNTLWGIFLLGFLGGFVALFTPCVWPIIPMTVSFFLKRSQDKRKGVRDAVLYGVSIVVIYVLLGLLVTMIFGASALNALSTNAVFNIFFFLMLLFFAASFLGGFEITLPSKWTNAVDKKSESTTGLLSIFLMAFTLSLVSFSCTGPIIGFLLVEVSTTGSVVAPTIGMLGFAVALALPFTLFALFPAWLKSAPKSGNWMNCIKVCLGFLELAFALKFLSVADLAYGWRILDREVFLSIWIVLFALLGAYLIGWIRFPHDEDEYDDMGEVVVNQRTSVPRFFMGLVSFAFALYMVPGLWGAPCKAVSAFAPPMSTQDFNLYQSEVKARFHDYEEGMAYAQANGLPVMLDFTGYGCVNCRKMEAAVWTDIKVADLLNEKYVLITLFVDDKTPLPEPIVVTENGAERKLRTIGDKWSYLQRSKFGANAQPFYVLLDNEGMPLNKSYSFNENVADYVTFLQQGLKAYHK